MRSAFHFLINCTRMFHFVKFSHQPLCKASDAPQSRLYLCSSSRAVELLQPHSEIAPCSRFLCADANCALVLRKDSECPQSVIWAERTGAESGGGGGPMQMYALSTNLVKYVLKGDESAVPSEVVSNNMFFETLASPIVPPPPPPPLPRASNERALRKLLTRQCRKRHSRQPIHSEDPSFPRY
jgi:hypothetical protein